MKYLVIVIEEPTRELAGKTLHSIVGRAIDHDGAGGTETGWYKFITYDNPVRIVEDNGKQDEEI